MSPESKKVTLSSSAGFPADNSRPSIQSQSQTQFQKLIPSNNQPIQYQRSPDYQDTTNQKPHYDSEHSQTISLKTGFRYNNNNPYTNSNDNNIPTKNVNQNFTYQTNDARHQTGNRDSAQRPKILDYIVSDTQPQSFQSPTRTPLSANDIKLVNSAFVNSDHESSSIIISTPSSIINSTSFKTPKDTSHSANDDNIHFVLNTGLNQMRNPNRTKINNNNLVTSDSVPLYTRQESQASSTTSTAVPRPRDEIVVPTTYSPLKNWKLQYVKRPTTAVTTLPLNTIANSHGDDKKHSTPFDEITFSTPVGPVKSKFPTPDYNRPSPPSAGTRQQSFREILNKTYETSTPSKYHVSPYTSLKSLLSEEPTRSSFRPTAVTPSSSTTPPTNPYRSYYIITAPTNKATADPTRSPTNFFSNTNQPTTTPVSITSSASTPVFSSNYEWTPINYNYNAKPQSSNGGDRLAQLKPTENSIDVEGVDMTTSYPTRNNFANTYYPRPTPIATTTPPSITTARIMLSTSGATSERDHYRKVVRMRSKKKVNPATGQPINDEGDIIVGSPYGKLTESVVSTNDNKNTYHPNHHQSNQFSSIEISPNAESSSKHVDLSTNVPTKFYSNYRHVKEEKTLADYISEHASGAQAINENEHRTQEPIGASTGHGQENFRPKFRATVEMPEFNIPTESEIKAKLKQLEANAEKDIENEEHYETTTALSRQDTIDDHVTISPNDRTKDLNDYNRRMTVTAGGHSNGLAPQTTTRMNSNLTHTTTTQRTINSIHTIPPRASRVNTAIKTTIAAASLPPTRRSNTATATSIRFATLPLLKCSDSTPNAKCNEIPSRYTNQAKSKLAPNRTTLFTKTIKISIHFLPFALCGGQIGRVCQHAEHESNLPK